MLITWLALATAWGGGDWFYPGPSDQIATIDADSRIGTMRVQRTGDVIARVEHPAVLQGLHYDVLGDDGLLVLIHAGADDVTLSRRLHDDARVRWAHPDLILPMRLHGVPDDPYLEDQWHLENTGQSGGYVGADIKAPAAWELSTGAGQLIGIFDSGVDATHEDLVVTLGSDFADGDDDASPDLSTSSAGHGTAVAGLAAAQGDNGIGVAGVAYDAELYAVRIIGGMSSLSDINSGFREAVNAGASVLNNSWGYGDGCEEFPTYGAISNGVNYAEGHGRDGLGTVVVFSAGNDSCDTSKDGILVVEEVVAVSATNDQDQLESYSNYGSVVDITAPAGGLLTTDLVGSDYGYGSYNGDADYTDAFNGTSASAPVVSGVFALMFAANERLTAALARQIVCETATINDLDGGDWDAEGRSLQYGCGRIDAHAAVAAVANDAPTVTVTGPELAAAAHRVRLTWEGDDPDDDPLSYKVVVWIDGDKERFDTEETTLDLTGLVSAGQDVTWKITPSDLWGEGTASEGGFTVVATRSLPALPVVTSGCGSAGAPWWLGLLGLGWLRRRQSSSRS